MADEQFVKGFKAIPVKINAESFTQHWFFIKEHSVREKSEGKPANRTLFIINVPPYCNEECFRRIFGGCGTITSVFFHPRPTASLPPEENSPFFLKHGSIKGYKVAYVVFETHHGLQRAIQLDAHIPLVLSTKDSPLLCGVQKWCQEYNRKIVDPEVLQKDIDSYIEKFDQDESKKALQKKESMEEDDEGWITVTGKGRRPGFARKESVKQKIMGKERLKRSKKELQNFYTFQIRESKMKHLVTLRKKFEEDKKRIITLKQSRRFKPF